MHREICMLQLLYFSAQRPSRLERSGPSRLVERRIYISLFRYQPSKRYQAIDSHRCQVNVSVASFISRRLTLSRVGLLVQHATTVTLEKDLLFFVFLNGSLLARLRSLPCLP